jgi:hypothetical protein
MTMRRLAANLAGRQPGGVLLQNLNDLLFSESALTQVRLPKERTLPKRIPLQDGRRIHGSINILWIKTAKIADVA